MLILNEDGVRLEGMHQFFVSNIPVFKGTEDLIPVVREAVRKLGWTPQYSRQLELIDLRWSRPVTYTDHSAIQTAFSKELLKERRLRMLLATIRNGREGKSAVGTIARLAGIRRGDEKAHVPSWDRSNLKASGYEGYTHTIWPKSQEDFDLLAIHLDLPSEIYLNSRHDFGWRSPIISGVGDYRLNYEVYADGFPLLAFPIELTVTGDNATTSACSGQLRARYDPELEKDRPGPY